MKRVWDVADLKTEDEKQLGQALYALILSTNRKVEVGSMPRLVEETAEPFVAARTRKDIDYTFTVLESDAVNAFSHPGGYVYVTSGLMNWIGEDQRYALEFLLAHEIAHVDLRHALSCLNDPGVKELGLGTLQEFLVLILPLGYAPDRLDFEADRWAYQQMLRLDRSKRERFAFLRKLEGYARDQGFENGRVPPRPNEEAAPIENHVRAHPAPYKRLKQLEALTAPAPAPARAR
jgi:Zn-dependent protease with chaperone function